MAMFYGGSAGTMNDIIASAGVTIDAPVAKVWDALTNPQVIKQYMFGTNVVFDWQEGSPIIWQGEWQGRKYEDKGVILKLAPERMIRYSHFSPLSGVPDVPENYHTVTVELSVEGHRQKPGDRWPAPECGSGPQARR